ncbi:hypothetical protein D9M68_711510 [compost metagenome]
MSKYTAHFKGSLCAFSFSKEARIAVKGEIFRTLNKDGKANKTEIISPKLIPCIIDSHEICMLRLMGKKSFSTIGSENWIKVPNAAPKIAPILPIMVIWMR